MITMLIAQGVVLGSWLVVPLVGILAFRRRAGVPGRHRNWS